MDSCDETPDLSGEVQVLSHRAVFIGPYSTVYRGRLRTNNRLVAIKVLNPIHGIPMNTIRRKINRERWTWSQLRHPNILPLYGFADGEELFEPFGAFISPWCARGDMAQYLREQGFQAPLDERIDLWRGVLAGVEYLHLHLPAIVHGDLKPGNVLINDAGEAQICDFGLVKILSEQGSTGMTTTTAHTGTERYLAYELVTGDESNPTMASDIYAVGCIGLELLFLEVPYSSRGRGPRWHILDDIRSGLPPASCPTDLSYEGRVLWDILLVCWDCAPDLRPSATLLFESLDNALQSATIIIPPNSANQPIVNARRNGLSLPGQAIAVPPLSSGDRFQLTASNLQSEHIERTEYSNLIVSSRWTVDNRAQDSQEAGRNTINGLISTPQLELQEETSILTRYNQAEKRISPAPARSRLRTLSMLRHESVRGSDGQQKANSTPAYLMFDHGSPAELILNPGGSVRAGTLPALIERLTMHSGIDARFTDTFMITFKTFATIDLVFDLLIERYDIQPPKGLTPEQLFEWTRVKKTPIRLRSINIMRKLIDVLEEEDLHVLDRVKSFCNDVVANNPSRAGVARALLAIVTRVETKGIEMKRTIRATSDIPPPSILPRKWGKFKLLDVDPLEMARQLTIMESELFVKVQQNECITRSKESVPSDPDSIKSILTVASKLADWVAKSILSKHDTTKRAATIKYFINVAERCRYLHNYSSMAALIAGLNSPPVRRLERTWENVSARNTAILDDLEKTLDTAHNFQGYKVIISSLQSPCVPFLGVCLTVLTFIPHDGNDILTESGLINFQKCQKIADVIQEIEKFQMRPYNLTKLANVRAFIDESLALLDNVPDLWQLSLEREPAEKEYEKTARLLQESGFL